ncbi:MAG: NUDIX hydrolase [Candidatus Liptonbacteria bacterium]|nr:NUDIX hydrolase [Candidatus Liptonbacteria bacterium]
MKIVSEKIPAALYRKIYKTLPIFCVDVVAVNWKREFLLVRRKLPPLRGSWWFPGGRVLKNETVAQTAVRKLREETNLAGKFIEPLGFYEFISPRGYFRGTNTHTPIVTCLVEVKKESAVALDAQSSDFRWASKIEKNFLKYIQEALRAAGF